MIPMAGKSSRFPKGKPKWMMTHPGSGRFMAIESIVGINLDFFDSIVFVCLKSHEKEFGFLDGFYEELEEIGLNNKSKIVMLEKQTSCQSETVVRAIEQIGIEGFLFIKDSDSFYRIDVSSEANQVAYFQLEESHNINPGSKSYLQIDSNGILTNIAEKKIISSMFSVGGYGFESSADFCKVFDKISQTNNENNEIYVSHVIFDMILSGAVFVGAKVNNYEDWGTYEDWIKYIKQYRCMFFDIDGVLVKNTSSHFSNLGTGDVLQKNVDFINKLMKEGKTTVILTTSRKEKYRKLTEEEMIKKGINYNYLLMGLPHCQRIVVNDFADSNPYPSCSAINLKRDESDINNFFKEIQ